MKYQIKVTSFFSFGRTGEVSEEGKELLCHTSCHAKKNKPKRSIFHRVARLFSLSFYVCLIFLSGAQQASAFCTSEVLVDNGNFTIGEYVNVFWYVPAGSGWYVANSPFDNPTGRAYTYKGPPVYENSDQVGGLYDTLNPAGNPAGVPATHMLNLLQETDGETSAIVYRFPRTFSVGDFKYSFDLSSRFKQNIFIDQYKVSLYNADTNTIEEILEQDFVDTIPHAASETPGWTTLSGDFTITTPGQYYLLFQIDQNLAAQNSDYMIDRVMVARETCLNTSSTGNGTLRYANSGVGQYKDRILFMDWHDSSLMDGIDDGDVVEFAIPPESCMANGTLTATFSNISDPVGIAGNTRPRDMHTWNGASFYQLYNTAGTGEAIYAPEISPAHNNDHIGFTITWNMVIDGQTIAPDIFFIDAESTTGGAETIDVTTNGGVWSVIENALNDVYVVDGIGTTQIQIRDTEDPNILDSAPDNTKGYSPLLLSLGATTTDVTISTVNNNGNQAVAFGLLVPCDHGDAPNSYGPAAHAFKEEAISASRNQLGLRFKAGTPYLGATRPDSEADTQQDPSPAKGDDNNHDPFGGARNDDEDIEISPLPAGRSVDITIPVNGAGFLYAWFDWNADGDFGDAGEHVANNINVNTGNTTLTVNIPSAATIGNSFARFRISTQENLSSTGYAKDGEVEDVAIEITESGTCSVDDLGKSLYSTGSVSANSGYLSESTRVYQAKFDTATWEGHLLAFDLETTDTDGSVKALKWDVADQLLRSGRKLFTYNPKLASNRGKIFTWANLSNPQKSILKNGQTTAKGRKRFKWVKGLNNDEGSFLRARGTILGDIINSNLSFKDSLADYGYNNLPEGGSYTAFLATKKNSTPTIFVGANDGMLHAFDASDGDELFAYIPNEIFPKLVTISNPKYGCSTGDCLPHEYLVDGKSSTADAYFASSSDWHTVLLGTLGNGGSGIFALDVSNAESFTANDVLWEISSNQAKSAGSKANEIKNNLGKALPSPSVVRMNTADANKRWAAVIGNGYESTKHKAVLFIIDIETGALIKKIDTGSGSVGSPNGLSSPTAVDSNNDSIVDRIYAGDLLGNLWAFDVSSDNPDNWGVDFGGSALFSTGKAITAPPQVGKNPAGGLMVYFGTGKYFNIGDNLYEGIPITNTYYGIHDNGSPVADSSLVEQTILQEAAADGTNYNVRITSNHPVDYSSHHGWYMNLPTAGERVISQALLRQGRLIFTTMTPPGNVCAWGGSSWLMEFDAVEGKRLAEIPIDINNDKKFTDADNVLYQGNRTILSGVQDTALGVVFSTPSVINHNTRTEGKYLTGTGGGVGMIRESASEVSGRISWRKVR